MILVLLRVGSNFLLIRKIVRECINILGSDYLISI